MPANMLQKNFTASGAITPPAQPLTRIYGVLVDAPGTVVITDGSNTERLHAVFGAPGLIMIPAGMSILCQNGATLTLTGVTNCGLFYGA